MTSVDSTQAKQSKGKDNWKTTRLNNQSQKTNSFLSLIHEVEHTLAAFE